MEKHHILGWEDSNSQMSILPYIIYTLNMILIKYQYDLYVQNLHGDSTVQKKIAGNPGKIRGGEKGGEKDLALPDIKTYYKTTLIMMVRYSS